MPVAVRHTQMMLGTNAEGRLVAVAGASVVIRRDGAPVQVYANRARQTLGAPGDPLPSGVTEGTAGIDAKGNMVVWLDPDDGYDAVTTVGGVSTTAPLPTITPDAEDTTPPSGVIVAGTGIDPTAATDSTAAINTKIANASAIGFFENRVVRVQFPEGVYLTDGIVAKAWTWLDFGSAVIKKRVNGTTPETNSMLRAVPVATVLTSVVTNKALTSNVATLTISAAHDYVVGSIVVVADVDATFNGTHTVTAVPSTTSFSYAKTAANVASTPSGGTATRTKYYGTYKNMKVTGGVFDLNGKTCPSHVVNLTFCENLVMEGTRVKHQSTNSSWAFVIGGRNLELNDLKVDDGTLIFQDGLHVIHGQNVRVNGGDFNTGDDCIALGGGVSTDFYLSKDPDPVRDVICANYRANSLRGNAFRIAIDTSVNGPLWEVTDVEVHGVVGSAGVLRNGGLLIESHVSTVDGRKMVRGVKVDGMNVDVGSTTHDDVNAFGVNVAHVENFEIDFTMKITENTANPIGWDLYRERDCIDSKVKAHCPSLGKRYGIDTRNSVRPKVMPGTHLYGGPNQTLNHIHFVDCVDPKVLPGVGLYNVPNGIGGIRCVLGTTTDTLTVAAVTVAHAAGATSGYAVDVAATALQKLILIGNDFSKAFAAVDPAVLTALGANAIAQANQGLADFPGASASAGNAWQLLRLGKARLDAATAQTLGLHEAGAVAFSSASGGMTAFYIDPAEASGAKLRLRASVLVNNVAPVASFTFGLYPVTGSAGTVSANSITVGAVVAGSEAVVTTPAANARVAAVSTEIDQPATAGWYALGVVVSANMNAASCVTVAATLQRK